MGRSKRQWQGPMNANDTDFVVPELDENNLPVFTPSPNVYNPEVQSAPSTFTGTKWQLPYSKLAGQSRPFWDEENMASEVQPTIAKYAKGLTSRGLSIIPKIGQNVGGLGGAVAYGMDWIEDPDSADPNIIWDNAITNLMSNADEKLRDILPIYKSWDGRNGNLLEQMSDAGFWADDVFDSLAFLASAYATGSGIGAIGKAAGLTGKALGGLKTYGSTVVNSIGEAGFEAKDFNDSQRNALAYDRFDKPFEYLDPDQQAQIKAEVSPGTANIFKGNLGVLLIPNYIQSKFLFGKVGDTVEGIRKAVRAGTLSIDDIAIFKTAVKSAGVGIVSEGLWEEGMQNALQTYNSRKANYGLDFDDYALGLANEWVDNWSTTEGQKNMFLGALIGSVFGTYGGVKGETTKYQQILTEENIWTLFKEVSKGYDNQYNEHLTTPLVGREIEVKDTDAEGNATTKKITSYIDKKGNLQIDQDKGKRMFMQRLWNKFMFDEAMVAAIDGDQLHLKAINHDALAMLYYNYATNGDMTNLDEVDDILIKKELEVPEELKALGYANKFTKGDLREFREAFEKAREKMAGPDDISNDKLRQGFKTVMAKTLYGEQVKRNLYEKLLREDISDEQKEQVKRIISDSEKFTKSILNKNTFEKLYKQWEAEGIERQKLNIAATRELIKNSNSKNKENLLEKAEFEYEEYKYINGETSPFSSAFTYDPRIKETALSNEFGALNGYYYNLGEIYKKKANLNDAINKAGRNKIKMSEVVGQFEADLIEGTQYSEDDLGKVGKMIEKKRAALQRKERDLAERKASAERTKAVIFDAVNGYIDNPEKNPEQNKADTDYITNYEAQVADLKQADERFQGVSQLPLPTEDKQLRNRQRAYRNFQRQFASKPLKDAMTIIESFKDDEKAFRNLSWVENTIKELKRVKRVYNGRKRLLTTNEFEGFIESIDEALVELEPILKAAVENQTDQEEKAKVSWRNYSIALFESIGIKINKDNSLEVVNKPLYDLIESILGKEELDKILAMAPLAVNDEIEYFNDVVFPEFIIDKLKNNPARIPELLELIKQQKQDRIDAFYQVFTKNGGSPNQKEDYQENPEYVFHKILEPLIDINSEIDIISVYDNYRFNHDIHEFREGLEKGEEIHYPSIGEKAIKEIVDAHLKVVALEKLELRLNSNISYADIIALEEAAFEGQDKAPNKQQRIVFHEALILQHQKDNNFNENYKGWRFITGLAGSGKTQLIIRYLSQMFNIGSENILALSTHPNALKTLVKSVKDIRTGILKDSFAEIENENTKIVIIDEITKAEGEDLQKFAETITAINKKRGIKNQITVFVLGDPSQMATANGKNSIITMSLSDLNRIRMINPLTTIFRSGNKQLTWIQDRFLGRKTKVKNLSAVASNKIGKPTELATIGVNISTQASEIIDEIKAQKVHGRTQVLVVNSESQIEPYRKLLGNDIEIMTPFAVNGLEFQEVYVDLSPDGFEFTSSFNRAMYTAISRASEYAFIKSYEPVGNWQSEAKTVEAVDTKRRSDDLIAEFNNAIQFEKSVIGKGDVKIKYSSKPKVDKTNIEQIEEESTDEEPEDSEELSRKNIDPIQHQWEKSDSQSNTIIDLSNPTSANVKDEGIKKGNKVLFIKHRIPGTKDEYQIQVIAGVVNASGEPVIDKEKGQLKQRYRVVGVLNAEELINTNIGKHLSNKIRALKADYSTGLSKGDYGTLTNENDAVLDEGTIHEIAPLHYQYEKTAQERTDLVGSLIENVQRVFKGKHKLSYSFKIFRNRDDKGKFQRAGIPYMIITRESEDKKQPFNQQYIRLTARNLSVKDTEIYGEIDKMIPIIEELETLGIGKLGEENFGSILRRFKNNFVAKEDLIEFDQERYNFNEYQKERKERGFNPITSEQFDRISELSKQFIPLLYGTGEERLEVKTLEEFHDKYPETKQDKDKKYAIEAIPDSEMSYVYSTTELHPEKEYWSTHDLVGNEGPVQLQMNGIAVANRSKNITWAVRHVVGRVHVTKAKSILSGKDSHAQYNAFLRRTFKKIKDEAKDPANAAEINKALKDQGIENLDIKQASYQNLLDKKNKSLTIDANIKQLEDWLIGNHVMTKAELEAKYKEMHTDPVTLETLKSIARNFNDDGLHPELFLPLDIKAFNELGADHRKNKDKLNDILRTNLKSINRTRVQVKLNSEINVAPDPKPKTMGKKIKDAVTSIMDPKSGTKNDKVGDNKAVPDHIKILQDKANKATRSGKSLLAGQAKDLGQLIGKKQASELLRKYLPDIEQQQEHVLLFIDKLLLKTLSGKDSIGLYQDEVIYVLDKNGKTHIKILKHEVFHKIFNEYLTPTEQDMLVEAFRKTYPDEAHLSIDDVEESLGIKFMDYEAGKLTVTESRIMRFFNWLSKILGYTNRNANNIQRLFETIESGYFTEKKQSALGLSRSMIDILKEFGDEKESHDFVLEVYKRSKKVVQSIVDDLVTSGVERNGVNYPVVRTELKEEIVKRIKADIEEFVDPLFDYATENKETYVGYESAIINKRVYDKLIGNLDNLLLELYPTWNKSLLQIIEDMSENYQDAENLIDQDSEEEKAEYVKQYTVNSDEVDYESKQSLVVKDFLNNIPLSSLGEDNVNNYMDGGEAFVRTLTLLEGIQTYNGYEDLINQLKQAWNNSGEQLRSKILVDRLTQFVTDAYKEDYGEKGLILSKNKKFLDDNTFVYTNEDTDITKIKGVYGARVNNLTIITRNGEKTDRFLNRIQAQLEDTSIETVIGYFNKQVAVNKLNSILTYFNNLKQKNYYFVERINEGTGVNSIALKKGAYIGISTNIFETIKTNMIDKFEDFKSFQKWYEGVYTKIGLNISNPLDFIKWTLRQFNMDYLAKDLPDMDSDTIMQNFKGMFNDAYKTVHIKTRKDKNGDDVIIDMGDYLNKQRRAIKSLSKPLSMSSAFIRATKIKGLDKKTKYIWSPTSFAHRVFFYLQNSRAYTTKHTNSKINMEIPAYLETPYFKHNIFINKKSQIFEVIDHDGSIVSSEWSANRIISFEDETNHDYLVREFAAGFIDAIDASPEKDISYVQYIHPNERPATIGLRVSLLDEKRIKDALASGITQILDKKDKPHLSKYNKNNHVNFRVIDQAAKALKIKITKANINKIVEKSYEILLSQADQLADEIINQKVPLDKDILSNSNLAKFLGKDAFAGFKTKSFYKEEVVTSKNEQKEYAVTKEQVLPMVELFFLNQYVNSYFVNQLIVGDYSQFLNEEDLMKRFAMATAPKHVPVVDDLIGMERKTKFIAVNDPKINQGGLVEMLSKLLKTQAEIDKIPILKKEIAKTDGQGLMLPERLEDLHNGLGYEFKIGNVLKPQIFSIDENGISKGVKYSSIVLTDAFIKEFPSFEIVRTNMRTLGVKELVFDSAVKAGNSTMISTDAMFSRLIEADEVAVHQNAIFEIDNTHYGIQHDPTAKIDSDVAGPSQGFYLVGVNEVNDKSSIAINEHLNALSDLGYERFSSKYGEPHLIRKNAKRLLQTKTSKREFEMISAGLSVNFPAIADKLLIRLSSALKKNVVQHRWPGTKLVQQSDYNIGKYGGKYDEGDNKLKSFKDSKGRLVHEVIIPEGLLEKDHEDRIKEAMKNKEYAKDYYTTQDLLGFRIPSSDIHSLVVMKVVGFYPNKTNVIIVPDLLIYVLGFDFDVDSLFTITRATVKDRESQEEVLVGYERMIDKEGDVQYKFIKDDEDQYESRTEKIAYHKNAILELLLDIVSDPANIPAMTAPIPKDPIVEQRDRVNKKKGVTQERDLSNYNNRLDTQSIIYGAKKAIGIFAISSKAIAHMLRTGPGKSNPKLRVFDPVKTIRIDEVDYNEIKTTGDNGEVLFNSLDGFINASLDNMKDLLLGPLNINDNTINAFIALKTLGFDLKTIVDLFQQPAMLEYGKIGNFEQIKKKLIEQSKVENLDFPTVELRRKQLEKMFGVESIDAMVKPTQDDYITQLKVIELVENAKYVGKDIGELGTFLSIAKALPVTKKDIEKKLKQGADIFVEINNTFKLDKYKLSTFSFDIPEFFQRNKHIHRIYRILGYYDGTLERTFKKYNRLINEFSESAAKEIGTYHKDNYNEFVENVRNELLGFLLSNSVFNDQKNYNKNLKLRYSVNNQDRFLTGPKAINQLFIRKIEAVKEFMRKQVDSQGNALNNHFIESLFMSWNPISRTKEIRFSGGMNLNQEDILDYQNAFYKLNQYKVTLDKDFNATVEYLNKPLAYNEYSDFQKEFVTYGIMNWGLRFGLMNYSYILPSDLYLDVDKQFNKILDHYTTDKEGKQRLDNIKDNFVMQFLVNNGHLLKPYIGEKILQDNKKVIDSRGRPRNVYQNQTDEFIYDISYKGKEGKEFPKYILEGYKTDKYIYALLNDPKAEIAYYVRLDRVSPVKYYHVSNEVVKNGYRFHEHFIRDPYFGVPIRNFQTDDFISNTVDYYGKGVEVGDIVSRTVYHDITREDKKYYKVTKVDKNGYTYSLKEIQRPKDKIITEAEVIEEVKPVKKTKKTKSPNVKDKIAKGEITHTDENFDPCAAEGMRGNDFTRGSQWEVVKDLKGLPSHEKGGIDIKFTPKGPSFKSEGGSDIIAAHGLLIPGE